MTIQFNTDNHTNGSEDFVAPHREAIEKALRRFAERVSSIQVHLSDENSNKGGGDDKKCVMEARIEKLEPIAVTSHAGTHGQAIVAATDKLKGALTSTFERMRSH